MSSAATADSSLALEERKRILDSVWCLIMAAVVVSLAIPWFLRAIEIDLAKVIWTVFGYLAFHFLATRATERLDKNWSTSLAVWALQTVGVIGLGLIWYLVGGVQNPVFLVIFLLPVAASGLLARRWHPYAIAVVSILVTSTVAIAGSSSLRWYLARLSVPIPGLEMSLWERVPQSPAPFVGFEVTPAHSLNALFLFAVLAVTMALASESMATMMIRLYSQLGTSGEARQEAETLARKVLQRSPAPAALVYSNDGRLVQASDSLVQQLLLDRDDIEGRPLVDLIDLAFPDVVARLLTGGEEPHAVYHVDGETRIARVTSYAIEHVGEKYTYFMFHDVTDLYYLKAALDAVDEAYLLLNAEGRVEYFNASAAAVFEGIDLGEQAEQAFARSQPTDWWRLGLRAAQRRAVTIDGNRFMAALSAAHVAGGEPLTVARLKPQPLERHHA